MRKKPIKISANEINRFVYCPYQWYYGRVYGQKVLKEKYLALEKKEAPYEGNFKRGLKFHEQYYESYRLRKHIESIIIFLFVLLMIWGMVQWSRV